MTTLDHVSREVRPGQRREWVVQRVAWVVMAGVVMAALAGVFGNGPLSRQTVLSQHNGLRLEYERFTRFQSIASLKVTVQPAWLDIRPISVVVGGG